MLEDRLDDGSHLVAVAVQRLERALCRRRRRGRDEVAPQLRDEEGRVVGVLTAEAAGVLPVEVAALAEDGLRARVVETGHVAEVVRPLRRPANAAPAGERAGLLADVLLRVPAVRAQGEELHHLAGVVLVRRPHGVLVAVQPPEHRRVLRHVLEELREGAEGVAPEELVLVDHPLLRDSADALGREPVVPHQRHAFDERARRANHAIQPPHVVVAVDVERCDRTALRVARLRPDEPVGAGTGQRADCAAEALLRESCDVPLARPEPGPPQQPLGLGGAEGTAIDGNRRHDPFCSALTGAVWSTIRKEM